MIKIWPGGMSYIMTRDLSQSMGRSRVRSMCHPLRHSSGKKSRLVFVLDEIQNYQ